MTIGTVLIGVDGSDLSLGAMEWTAGLAEQLGCSVVAIHAYEPLAHLGEVEPPVDFAALESSAAERLARVWCRALIDRGVSHTSQVMEGRPVDVLLDAAREHDADLIVVGARGLGAVRGVMLGSTSLKLSHQSEVPVVIVPASSS